MTRAIRLLPILALFAFAACETVEGAGQDLSKAGSAISHEARKTEKQM